MKTQDYNITNEVPGMSEHDSRVTRFHACLNEMMERYRSMMMDNNNGGGVKHEKMYATAVLEGLAGGCREMGLSEEFSVRMAGFQPIFSELHPDAIKAAFNTAYLDKVLGTMPMKYMRKSALLAFRTEAYMRQHYQLRFNVMTGVPEYKHVGGLYDYAELDQKMRNTMAINALKAGVDSWDKDLDRYIDSTLIPQYEPLRDYMTHLPRWDGKDRITPLAARVKTVDRHWTDDFHRWMLSMVAQWLNCNREHGNAIVPLLIGPQGSGKTTFCRRLLPEVLQRYYNDRLSMKNDNDIYIAMSSLALINIDEFDAMSRRQQPVLKYLISKHDVKLRPPYGKVIEQRQRYASFIATTNCRCPLVDATGSRRFLCVYADKVDNGGTINHSQVYAQLLHELEGRTVRYWFNDADNERLMKQNARYQQVTDYETMLRLIYMPAAEVPDSAPYVTVNDIMHTLMSRFPTVKINRSTSTECGKALRVLGYEHKKYSYGMAYKISMLHVQ